MSVWHLFCQTYCKCRTIWFFLHNILCTNITKEEEEEKEPEEEEKEPEEEEKEPEQDQESSADAPVFKNIFEIMMKNPFVEDN